MKKIEELTKIQEELLSKFREKWLTIGLSTEPIDFDKSKKIISNFYERIGKKPPIFLKFSSPLVTQFAMNLMEKKGDQLLDQLNNQLSDQLRGQLRDQLSNQLNSQLNNQLSNQLRDQLWGQLDNQLNNQLSDQLSDQLWGQLNSQLNNQLSNQLRDQLNNQLNNQLSNQLRDQLNNQLSNQLRDQLNSQLRDRNLRYFLNYFSGSIEGYWIAYYLFANKIGVFFTKEQYELLNLWADLAKSCFFWYPFDNFCFLSERPTKISFDLQKRLHDERDSAIRFSDETGLYAWHGLRVPSWIIKNPEKITIDKINQEQNAEIRRVMCERYGWDKYFKDRLSSGKCKLLDTKQVWGQPVKLFSDSDEGIERHFVHVINGTQESDGSRHEFIINCKNIDNDAEKSVYGTYPELIDRIKIAYPHTWLQELRNSIRT